MPLLRTPTDSCFKVSNFPLSQSPCLFLLRAVQVVNVRVLLTDCRCWKCAEETNKKSLEKTVQRMGKEAVQWGLVAGVYTGMTYGMQEARGVHDWVCPHTATLFYSEARA
jgi:hypothetical protein